MLRNCGIFTTSKNKLNCEKMQVRIRIRNIRQTLRSSSPFLLAMPRSKVSLRNTSDVLQIWIFELYYADLLVNWFFLRFFQWLHCHDGKSVLPKDSKIWPAMMIDHWVDPA